MEWKRCAVGAARASVGTHSTLLLHSSGTESRPSVAVLPPQEGGGLHLRCSIGAVRIISSMRLARFLMVVTARPWHPEGYDESGAGPVGRKVGEAVAGEDVGTIYDVVGESRRD